MREMYENKDVSIMCPNCDKFLVMADKRDERTNIIKCKHCGKLITYTPATNCREVGKVPPRTSSQGMRFY